MANGFRKGEQKPPSRWWIWAGACYPTVQHHSPTCGNLQDDIDTEIAKSEENEPTEDRFPTWAQDSHSRLSSSTPDHQFSAEIRGDHLCHGRGPTCDRDQNPCAPLLGGSMMERVRNTLALEHRTGQPPRQSSRAHDAPLGHPVPGQNQLRTTPIQKPVPSVVFS